MYIANRISTLSLQRWYCPGVETILHKFNLQPGGELLNEMKWSENSMLSKAVFEEVTAPERLVWTPYGATAAESGRGVFDPVFEES